MDVSANDRKRNGSETAPKQPRSEKKDGALPKTGDESLSAAFPLVGGLTALAKRRSA